MVNYSKGKIYKIENSITNEIYIGSTCKDYLSQRMQKHRSDYKRYKEGKIGKVSTVFDLFDKYGVENFQIILIEAYNANSKDDLHSKEAFYIKSVACVNKNIPLRNLPVKVYQKEYKEKNYEKINEYLKNYYDKTKDKYNEERKQIINCVCGCSTLKANIKRHEKSKKHLNNIVNLISK